MANLTDFRYRFPEFDAIADERIELFLNDSDIMIPANWGAIRDIGIYYLTAHHLAVSIKTSTGNVTGINQIASKSVEGVSVSYATKTSTDNTEDYYLSTSYGKRYLDIRNRKSVGAVFSV